MYRFDDDETRDLPVVAAPEPSTPWWRTTPAFVGAALAMAVLMVMTFVALRPDPQPTAIDPGPNDRVSASQSPSPTASPSPSASPTPSPTPAPVITRTQAVVPIPSEKPPPAQLPPPPPPPVSEAPSCTQWDPAGDAPPAQVRTALAAAGSQQYWLGVQPPTGWPGGPYPVITIPAGMMNAIAWTESTWRSTVIACDQGIGLMQVMPATAPWMNQRFGRSYDVSIVDGNAALGAMYLQWLIMYFGLYYFGSFDLDVVEAVGDGGTPVRLRDVVIAAYNVGYHEVENLNGTPDDGTDDTLSIPNQWYVDRVYGYMSSCPCDAL